MSSSQSFALRARRIAAGSIALFALAACSDAPNAPTLPAPRSATDLAAVGRDNDLGPALAAQGKHTGRLMADRELLGTAVGRLDDGRPEVTVFAKNAGAAARVPRDLDGIPVTVEVTGEITALPAVAHGSPRARPGGGGGSVKPTDYARPAYVGMSTGNAGECAAGTIGAKINKGGTIYALSNNHVYARENAASLGETIYQPGRYDLNCASGSQYAWATLGFFRSISFSGTNTVDVALAKLNNANDLSASTPPGGYGTPASGTATASVGQAVMKYGRTTGLTTGTVTGINVTIRVQYTDGIATFANQVQIKGNQGSFSRAGDSGSLIVTQSGRIPIALLFAGGQTSTFGNPIGPVLQAVGGSIVTQ